VPTSQTEPSDAEAVERSDMSIDREFEAGRPNEMTAYMDRADPEHGRAGLSSSRKQDASRAMANWLKHPIRHEEARRGSGGVGRQHAGTANGGEDALPSCRSQA
jgi:hypothetical protein